MPAATAEDVGGAAEASAPVEAVEQPCGDARVNAVARDAMLSERGSGRRNDPHAPQPGQTTLRRVRMASRFEQQVAGVDEAGRGPWAGPVVVAAVILPRGLRIEGLADSKLLTAEVREVLYDVIVREAAVSTVVVRAGRVDAMNIRRATLWGMGRAVACLPGTPTVALVDGVDVPPDLAVRGRAIVRGDQRSTAISAASIVAKVTRDRLMIRLAEAFPHYGFERHKGYGTPEHREALEAHGPCVHHRRSFAPVREALSRLGVEA